MLGGEPGPILTLSWMVSRLRLWAVQCGLQGGQGCGAQEGHRGGWGQGRDERHRSGLRQAGCPGISEIQGSNAATKADML